MTPLWDGSNAPADLVPAAVADLLHHWPPVERHFLPDPAIDSDRLDSGDDLGGLCAVELRHRSEVEGDGAGVIP